MKYLLSLVLSILSLNVYSQEVQLKKGLLMPNPDGSFDFCCIYLPQSGLEAFDQPNGKVIARIEPDSTDHNGEAYQALIRAGQELRTFDYTNFYMVGYEVTAMEYVDQQGDFVQTVSGHWLSTKELQSKGLVLTTWMDYLIETEVLGWYANDPGLNLRTGPSVNDEILATLRGDLWEITPTKEVKGLWCKVTVKQYREHPCFGGDNLVIKTFTGWVKLLSDNQTPNVWNYSKGC